MYLGIEDFICIYMHDTVREIIYYEVPMHLEVSIGVCIVLNICVGWKSLASMRVGWSENRQKANA